ncbi:Uncharacterised protein [Mycolicibacterium flavescens]|uniref:hypothetical protein n=1 Tax=Mycobacterium neumannii TaxID=2048551 RepID=UPI000B93FD6F|nr:hypothetical protein [Mycobacterium neumannii]VEG40297.1 Uncharacterised protein [Mycolicibacterium flavescens]
MQEQVDEPTDQEPTPDQDGETNDSTEVTAADSQEEAAATEAEAEAETFPRSYVEELRQENGKHRQRAQKAEQRLHAELVRATGRLADAEDLPFNPEHLDDAEKLTAAIDELLTRKPHLAARRPTGYIGQGATQSTAQVNLHDILRSSA